MAVWALGDEPASSSEDALNIVETEEAVGWASELSVVFTESEDGAVYIGVSTGTASILGTFCVGTGSA